jgi:hypothetical protein
MSPKAAMAEFMPSLAAALEQKAMQQADTSTDTPPLWRRILVTLGAVAVAIGIFFLGMMFFGGCSASPGWNYGSSSGSSSTTGPTLLVSKTDHDAYPTLEKAILAATPGARIKLMDATIEEQIELQPSKRVPMDWDPPVIVESGNDKPTLWRARQGGKADDALLHVEGVRGLEFHNVVLDGEQRVDKGIELLSVCPGVVLEKLEFRGFTKSDIVTWSAAGYADRPIKFLDLHATATAPRNTPSIFFHFHPEIKSTERTQHIVVQGCRFDGAFKSSPVEHDGNIGNLQWQNNIWIGSDGQKTIAEPK